jgi:hypothetical protein
MIYTCSWATWLTIEKGVYMGSGIGSLDDVYDTTVAFEKGASYPELTFFTVH